VHRHALAPDGVEEGAVELVVVGLEAHEELQDLVVHALGVRVAAVDLVDHHDRLQPELQRLARHEARLGHGALGGVHQHDHAVHHAQDALDLASEVGVARGVDDVDLVTVPGDREVLGQDGDAALALERVGVHHPLHDALVLAEGAGLTEHVVDQRGLAVVDVCDDRDVPDIHLYATSAVTGRVRAWWCGPVGPKLASPEI
jgi:hypothetical protein